MNSFWTGEAGGGGGGGGGGGNTVTDAINDRIKLEFTKSK